jgi:hypothetical protein
MARLAERCKSAAEEEGRAAVVASECKVSDGWSCGGAQNVVSASMTNESTRRGVQGTSRVK